MGGGPSGRHPAPLKIPPDFPTPAGGSGLTTRRWRFGKMKVLTAECFAALRLGQWKNGS